MQSQAADTIPEIVPFSHSIDSLSDTGKQQYPDWQKLHRSRTFVVPVVLQIESIGESYMRKLFSKDPPEPVHVEGMHKGEEAVFDLGREAGRGEKMYRGARDSTGINAKDRAPILPIMPELPPA